MPWFSRRPAYPNIGRSFFRIGQATGKGRSNGVRLRKSRTPCRSGRPSGVRRDRSPSSGPAAAAGAKRAASAAAQPSERTVGVAFPF